MAAVIPAFRPRDQSVRVFFGGARAGDGGGPLVKIKLLADRFPEHRVGYSLLYLFAIFAAYLVDSVVGRALIMGGA